MIICFVITCMIFNNTPRGPQGLRDTAYARIWDFVFVCLQKCPTQLGLDFVMLDTSGRGGCD